MTWVDLSGVCYLVEYGSSHGRGQPGRDHAVVQGGVTALGRLHAWYGLVIAEIQA